MSPRPTVLPPWYDGLLISTRRRLLQEREAGGHWNGQLSSSALSTAVALFALAQVDASAHAEAVEAGLLWLARNANADGGWGDSPESPSNLSTTLLAWSALSGASGEREEVQRAERRAARWIAGSAGSLDPCDLSRAVLSFYGNDRTFSAPILLMAALAGRLGPSTEAWARVPQLPLELAALPQGLFRHLRLPVVSYALPALIAIGLCRHRNRPSRCAVTRSIRNRVAASTLGILERIQPAHGGYLEAAPLTGFVAMSLAAAGERAHPVARKACRFLLDSMRPDGSWPIDANLATWVTTLSVQALSEGPCPGEEWPLRDRRTVEWWLLDQQFQAVHPFTRSSPGGWAWTDLPGGVPDADDTAGAVLALRNLGREDSPTGRDAEGEAKDAAQRGISWLLGIQNQDGGFPTFCRGWGRLPFDRSCPDITAHALQAMSAWCEDLAPFLRNRVDRAISRALRFLVRTQEAEGFWLPLWFGNQFTVDRANPVFGTARVLCALDHPALSDRPVVGDMLAAGRHWLLKARNADGGWGGNLGAPSSIEETALALGAMAGHAPRTVLLDGAAWLDRHTEGGRDFSPSPIGLYFASLWYAERLYPLVFSLWALQRTARALEGSPHGMGPEPGQAEGEPEADDSVPVHPEEARI